MFQADSIDVWRRMLNMLDILWSFWTITRYSIWSKLVQNFQSAGIDLQYEKFTYCQPFYHWSICKKAAKLWKYIQLTRSESNTGSQLKLHLNQNRFGLSYVDNSIYLERSLVEDFPNYLDIRWWKLERIFFRCLSLHLEKDNPGVITILVWSCLFCLLSFYKHCFQASQPYESTGNRFLIRW